MYRCFSLFACFQAFPLQPAWALKVAPKAQLGPTEALSAPQQCRNAVEDQRRKFSSLWQPQVGHQREGHEAYNEVISHESSNLAYVANQKAGSVSMKEAFGVLDGPSLLHRVQYSGAQAETWTALVNNQHNPFLHINISHQWNFNFTKETLKGKFLFTFVREPMACAWSAYTEVSHRAAKECDDLGLTTPCNMGDQRYHEYLDLLSTGQLRHHEVFHSFPQAAKVDVLNMLGRESFDFIGRLENFEADMQELNARLTSPLDKTTLQNFVDRFAWSGKHDVHERDQKCDQEIAETSSDHGLNNQTCRDACTLYEIDFVCFNYPRPKCCS